METKGKWHRSIGPVGDGRRTPGRARRPEGRHRKRRLRISSPQTTANDLGAVADAIRSHDRFVVDDRTRTRTAMRSGRCWRPKLALDALGKDAVMYLAGEAPLPREYSWMPLDDLRRSLPDDAAARVLLALDCANESRLGPDPEVLRSAPLVVNVDHHHDNSRFGDGQPRRRGRVVDRARSSATCCASSTSS